MIKRLKYFIAIVTGVFILSMPSVMAATCTGCDSAVLGTKEAIACGTKNASADCSDISTATNKANTALQNGINLASLVGGILAVIFVIVGGYRYITSGGASDKVTNAKNTILYALIGLVIIALAQVLVKFVLNQATG